MSETTVLCVMSGDGTDGAQDRLAAEPGLSVTGADSLSAAKEAVREGDVDCLVTAHDLPNGTGVDLVRFVREAAPDTGCILYTDADRETITAEASEPVIAEYVDRDSPNAADRLATLVSVTASRRTQTAYPLPDDEDDRLEALADLHLDSPSLRRAFERVSDLAAEHFGVDRTSVNIIGKRTQEVLACRGADWTTIPREETICTYSILNDELTIIEDTAADPRFESNEGLADMDIRFYAGAPLTTGGGLPVGTLCVYDDDPREFTTAEERYLRLLAEEAEHWLELHGGLADTGGDDGRGATVAADSGGERR